LPWLGYISKAAMADVYFILDNVQYVKDVFQNRNKIRVKQGEGWCWLNIPVIGAKTHIMKWSDVRIDNGQKWVKKHLNTIYHSYSKTLHFQPLYEKIEKIYLEKEEFLLDFILKIIILLLREYEVNIPIHRVSKLNDRGYDITGTKSDLIVKMCESVKAKNFVFGILGRDYMDKQTFVDNDINYYFQNFEHPKYSQKHGNFLSNMSSIDLFFNHGKDSIKILGKSGGDTE
jgi:hypothetical protein